MLKNIQICDRNNINCCYKSTNFGPNALLLITTLALVVIGVLGATRVLPLAATSSFGGAFLLICLSFIKAGTAYKTEKGSEKPQKVYIDESISETPLTQTEKEEIYINLKTCAKFVFAKDRVQRCFENPPQIITQTPKNENYAILYPDAQTMKKKAFFFLVFRFITCF